MTNIVFSPALQAPIGLAPTSATLPFSGNPPTITGKFPLIPTVGNVSLVTAAVRLALAMSTTAGALSASGATPTVTRNTVTKPAIGAGALSASGIAPTLTTGTTQVLTFPRVALVGNGGDQSYGSNASTGYPQWTTAAAGSAANTAIQTIGAYDLAVLAGVFEGWDTNGARDRENLCTALNKSQVTYTVTKNNSRPTLAFFYHIQSEGNPSGSGTGYDLLIAQINAMNGWLYESPGGAGTRTPSAFGNGAILMNYSTAWPGAIGNALTGQSIVGANYGSLSSGPTGQQGVARTNGSYAADKLLIKGSTGDTRWAFNAQMAAPSAAGIFLDNCFAALDGAGTVANSSLDGINMFPGAQQGGGYPGLDTPQPVMARGIYNFFDQVLTMTATYGTPGKVYEPFGNIGQYANKYQFGSAVMTIGLEGMMKGGLLEDSIGAGAPSWEYQQTGKAGGGNWTSGWVNLLANYYQGMDFCVGPKRVVLGARLPSASAPSSWVNGGGSTLVSVTYGSALEYQEMRYGLCTALLDDGYFGVGTSGYDWAGPRWYDEFGDDSLTQVNVKRGYLGVGLTTRPTSATWAQGTMGVWSRAFTNGIAIVNPRGNGAQTVALGGTYKALQGTQQPSINNGAYVTSVSLADGDGRILLGPMAPLQITTASPLSPAMVGTAYNAALAATGGGPPYTWSMPSATPNSGGWLSIAGATGTLSGTPGTAETENLSIKVVDSVASASTQAFSLLVNPSADPRTAPLVQASDITYLGSFTLPSSAGGVDWTFGGQGIGIGPLNNGVPTLLYCANGNSGTTYGKVGQFTIPAIGGTASLVSSGTISLSQRWTNDTTNSQAILGTHYDSITGKILVSGIGTYSNSSQDLNSMASGSSTFTAWTTPQPTSNTESPRLGAGKFGPVPHEWQPLVGGNRVYSVQSPHSIDANAENGCGIFTFDPASVSGSGNIPVSRLIHYPYNGTANFRGNSSGTSLFIETCYVSGAAWVPNTRSVVFFGQRAMGSLSNYYSQNPFNQCYGLATACSDPCQTENKGFHGYPYRINMWLYDMAAALSAPNTWTPLPYADVAVPGGLGSNGCFNQLQQNCGGAYDPITSNFYLSLGDQTPTIYVFHINHP